MEKYSRSNLLSILSQGCLNQQSPTDRFQLQCCSRLSYAFHLISTLARVLQKVNADRMSVILLTSLFIFLIPDSTASVNGFNNKPKSPTTVISLPPKLNFSAFHNAVCLQTKKKIFHLSTFCKLSLLSHFNWICVYL